MSEGLSPGELDFYARQIVLGEIGYQGQLRLKGATVCLVGLGGLGCPAALQLAAMGVGRLRLVDYDVVELSNLQRQHLYSVTSVGLPKVEAAAERIRGLNPHIEIEPLPLAVTEANAERIVRGADVVVDGLDRMAPRYAVNRACARLGVPYVFGAAITTLGNASTIVPGETACLECFQGGLEDSTLPSCSIVGVHPSILSIVASVQVSEAARLILGEPPVLADRLLYCNLDSLEFEKIRLARAERCPVCGDRPSVPAPFEPRPVTELCARGGRRTFAVFPEEELDLDMGRLDWLLAERGFAVRARGELGVTFDAPMGVASVLKSGIMIAELEGDAGDARRFHQELVVEGLGHP